MRPEGIQSARAGVGGGVMSKREKGCNRRFLYPSFYLINLLILFKFCYCQQANSLKGHKVSCTKVTKFVLNRGFKWMKLFLCTTICISAVIIIYQNQHYFSVIRATKPEAVDITCGCVHTSATITVILKILTVKFKVYCLLRNLLHKQVPTRN